MNFFGRKKREESALSEEVREELEALCDQAELAESVEEHRAINKSILELVGEGMDEIVKAVGKQRAKSRRRPGNDEELDDEEIEEGFDDDEFASAEGDGEEDEDEDEDETADRDLLEKLKRARRGGKRPIRKSVREDLEEDEADEVDAVPILKSIAERLGEFEGVQTDVRKSAARLSRLESRFDEVSAALTPLLEFVDEMRDVPVGTPRGQAPLAAGAVHKSIAATTGQAEYADVTLGDGSTLRGLTEMQLLKGVAAYLDKNGETRELGISDLHRIGREPIENLNPKLAEFAAEGLGIALKE